MILVSGTGVECSEGGEGDSCGVGVEEGPVQPGWGLRHPRGVWQLTEL